MNAQMPAPGLMPAVKPAGLYLLELRRHFAETHSRRRKLEVASWAPAREELIAIRRQPFPSRIEPPVS